MADAVYKIIELTGTSKTDIEGAVQNAVSRASETLRNLKWFEVVQTRGHVENDRVAAWQVTIKIGFDIESEPGEKGRASGEKGQAEKGAAKEGAEEKKADKGLSKYRCKVCGYVYDPANGDDTQGVKPGTSFEDLPGSWTCPECGAAKTEFEMIS